jgi:predicted metalloprotease
VAKLGSLVHRWSYAWTALAVLILLLPLASGVSAQTPTPVSSGYRVDSRGNNYQGVFADLAQDIDGFWEATFTDSGVPYTSPAIVTVDHRIETACGPVEPIPNALYCPGDSTIYLMPDFLTDLERDLGDYAPMTVLGHEWGHHVQALSGAQKLASATFELQADCLAGVFTRYARDSKLLDVGDFIEALNTSESAGDPISLPVDNPGAHGSPEDRVLALTEGFWLGPEEGCRLPLLSPDDGEETPPVVYAPGVEQPILLRGLPLPRSGCFRPQGGGLLTLEELTERFTNSSEATSKLEAWNWEASAVREFSCTTAASDEVNWFEIGVHRFGTAADARTAADYFASVRAEAYGLQVEEVNSLGDIAIRLSGTAPDGEEVTLYTSEGPWLVRVSGVSAIGDPSSDVEAVIRGLLAAQPAQVSPGQEPVDGSPLGNISAAFLPVSLAIPQGSCFSQDDRGAYRFQNFADKMAEQGFASSEIADMGWKDGAFVMFSCDDASSGQAEYLDVVIHSFVDSQAAQSAFPFVRDFYEPDDHEDRACEVSRFLVICVDGRAPSGTPRQDVQAVLENVVAGTR